MTNYAGQSLGRYHVVEQLGEGGMATVYKAYDTRLERDVAIKVIRTDQFGAAVLEGVLKRFEREAKALARLTHPNIVHINDYGEQDGTPYLVMDYLPGGTLKPRLGKPMQLQEAIRILLPVAHALEYAHSQNIIHRDVKPSNILITQSNEPMLGDFGIAKMLESEGTTALTGTGVGVGTPEYMAPEQWTGQVTAQSDIYSLGVVFFEMVTGRKPYTADTPAAILLKQASEPLPRPRLIVPDLPEGAERILFKALARKPEDRYQRMGDFAAALEQLTHKETGQKTLTQLAGKPAEQGTVLQPGRIRENLTAAGGAGSFPPAPSQMKMRRGMPGWGWAVLGVLGLLGMAGVVWGASRLISKTLAPAAPTATAIHMPAVVLTPEPTLTPVPTRQPEPSITPEPTRPPEPTITPAPSDTPTVSPTDTLLPAGPGVTSIRLTLVTGEDGTANYPLFELFDTSGGTFSGQVVFSTSLNQAGDLQPFSKVGYEFTVAAPFCKIAGWHLSKPAVPAPEDAWLLNEIFIELNDQMVYRDTVFSDQGAMTAAKGVRSGNWVGTSAYKGQCGG